MFQRASVVELAQLADVLEPPCELGPYMLTSALARSERALLFTATGGPFGAEEGVLKLTSSHHAGRLRSELERLVRCADGGVTGVVQPLSREPDWLPVPDLLDAHVATLAMPFLSGGDLNALRRTSQPAAREVALTVGETLRHMLELPEPLTHGSLSMRSVMLPHPGASLSELTLLDLGAARDLRTSTSAEIQDACRADVVAFGSLLAELTTDELRGFCRDCRNGRFTSLADPHLWRSLRQGQGVLARLRSWSWSW